MLETPHVIVGAAIASKIPNPYIAIPLSFLSHFALERVPHWNPHLNTETKKYGRPTLQTTMLVVVDVIFSLSFGFLIAYKVGYPDSARFLTILASCFASVLPDIVEGPYFFLGVRNKILKKWIIIQKKIQVDTTPLPGILTQLVLIITCFWWIFS